MKANYKFQCTICLFQLCVSASLFSQDLIIFKTGDEVSSKVMEILPDVVKYKKWDNQEGPMYSVNKADIFMIKYQNGSKDVFNSSPAQPAKAGDNSGQVIETARQFMSNQVASESKGACKLLEFYKQNGIEKEVLGQKMYTLEYRLVIEVLRGFWKSSSDKWLGKDWYWKNFSVQEKKGDVYAETFTNNYSYFSEGTKIEITGEIDFENTDNGWRIAGKGSLSSSYKNTSSRIISYPDPAASKKPAPLNTDSLANELKGQYTGDLKDGKKEGQGKMIYNNGNVYEGFWRDDKKNGTGKMQYKSGVKYEGEWKDDKREGDGTVYATDGRKYVGKFSNDVENGPGIMYDKNGDKISEGNRKNGLMDGQGILLFKDDEVEIRYEGQFKEDKFHGQGVMVYTEKKTGKVTTLTGEFKDGELFNGTGVEVNKKGDKRSSEVINGKEGKVKKEKAQKE